jgi:hypothetical protein
MPRMRMVSGKTELVGNGVKVALPHSHHIILPENLLPLAEDLYLYIQYVWDTATPYRDGDLESGIVIHEYR